MTKKFVGICVLASLVVAQHSAWAQNEKSVPKNASAKAATQNSLVGSWRIVSFKYGGTTQFAPWPKNEVMLKHITPTHFTWATYDAKTGIVTRMAGGTYTWDGTTYRENLQYGFSDGIKDLIGKPQNFTDQVDGDTWRHSGKLSQGLKIEEVWQRVK